jgi:4-amino-4-deoxychorismate lyase
VTSNPSCGLINGELRSVISVRDRGFQYGDGLFETLRVVNGVCQYWQEHMDRLETGCQKLGLLFPGRALLETEVNTLNQSLDSSVVKIIITRGVTERGYRIDNTVLPTRVLLLDSMPQYPAEYYRQGIDLFLCQQRLGNNPQLAGIKHLNRLEQVMARREWADEYQEGLLLDQFSQVGEGTMSNVFIIDGKALLTPKLERCGVHGIIREQILRQTDIPGIKIKQEDFSIDRLLKADAVFLCNSLIGIWPVRSFEEQTWELHPMIFKLQRAVGFAL